MPRCHRCAAEFVRTTVEQIHCPQCQREVAALIAADARRRVVRFARAADLTGRVLAR